MTNLSTPTLALRPHNRSRTKSRSFLVEALLLLVFLSASVAVILQVFVAAGTLSRDAHALSVSEHLAVNALERFQASPTKEFGVSYFTEQGEALPGPFTATFAVNVESTPEDTAAGTLVNAVVTVTDLRATAAGQAPYQISSARYLSRSEGGTP